MSDYIMARSSTRMHERINNRYSTDIFRALCRVDDEQLSKITILPAVTPLRKSQLKRDKRFLEAIHRESMQNFLGSIDVAVPNLLEVPLDRTTSFYGPSTAKEVHSFLVRTLEDFRDTVKQIAKRQYKGGVPPKPGAEKEQEGRRDLVIRVECASQLLCLFIYSSAAFTHFEAIRGVLLMMEREIDVARRLKEARKNEELAPLTQPESDVEPPVVDDIDDELECGLGDDDGEDDLTTLANHADNEAKWDPTTKKYLRSIRRHVSHMEAINILCAMCRKLAIYSQIRTPVVSVTALAVPYPGNVIMPWKNLVQEIWPADPAATIWSAQDVIDRLSQLDRFSDEKFRFGGTIHCEACLVSLLDMNVLNSLVRASRYSFQNSKLTLWRRTLSQTSLASPRDAAQHARNFSNFSLRAEDIVCTSSVRIIPFIPAVSRIGCLNLSFC